MSATLQRLKERFNFSHHAGIHGQRIGRPLVTRHCLSSVTDGIRGRLINRRYMSTNGAAKEGWSFNDSYDVFEKAIRQAKERTSFEITSMIICQLVIMNISEKEGKLVYAFNIPEIEKD
ncbi:hypothetical protein Tco_0206083 [Tanacetum coccineum]